MRDSITQDKALRLFKYLKELSQLRTRPVYELSEYENFLWLHEIPKEKGCFCAAWDPSIETPENWIEVHKPKRPNPPKIPTQLQAWVNEKALNDSKAIPALSESIVVEVEHTENGESTKTTQVLLVQDKPTVEEDWKTYLATQWQPWAENDQKLHRVEELYKQLFGFYQKQQKLGETFEIVLGIGLLNWKRTAPKKSIKRPIFTTAVAVSFDAKKGIVSVGPPAEGSRYELEQEMLTPEERPAAANITSLEGQLAEIGDDIWNVAKNKSLLETWISGIPTGQVTESMVPASPVENRPILSFAPLLILRKKTERSLIRVFEEIITQIGDGAPLPIGMRRLVEIMDDTDKDGSEGTGSGTSSDPEIYFPLPANREQKAIAQRISSHHGVLVQGPPGTGKSHTIANLICHLLATGKKILVTSQTSRALRVLQEKFPAEIAPLCVSVLSEDLSGLKELENSVVGITSRHNNWDSESNKTIVAEQQKILNQCRKDIAAYRRLLLEIREQETIVHPLKFHNYSGTLSKIATAVSRQAPEFDWFEDVVDPKLDPQISEHEASELAQLLASTNRQTEAQVSEWFPDLSEIPTPAQVLELFAIEKKYADQKSITTNEQVQVIEASLRGCDGASIRLLQTKFQKILGCLESARVHKYFWSDAAIEQILSERDRKWKELANQTCEVLKIIEAFPAQTWECEISGLEGFDLAELTDIVSDLNAHFKKGGGTGFLFFKSNIVKKGSSAISKVRVNGKKLEDTKSTAAFLEWARLHSLLKKVRSLWNPFTEMPKDLNKVHLAEVHDLMKPIYMALDAAQIVGNARGILRTFRIPEPKWNQSDSLSNHLLAFQNVLAEVNLRTCDERLATMFKVISEHRSETHHPIVQQLTRAISLRSLTDYQEAFANLNQLIPIRNQVARKIELFKLVALSAPRFAGMAQSANDFSVAADRMASFHSAYRWKQCFQWIQTIIDPNAQQTATTSLNMLVSRERECISRLASELAWGYCFSRMDETQRQHLIAWSKAVKKIGKGTGKHAAKYRKEARESMQHCRKAIPAWIMPLQKVAETVDIKQDAFDVVIIDEASQSGPEALFLYFIAKKVIVVGDDKQISPEAFVDENSVQTLREKWISDIPHCNNIGTKDSFFEFAEIRFSGRIRLREHFRCMPEIIQFSNNLCYASEPLIPLKQYGGSRLQPLVQRHVPEGYQQGSAQRIGNPPEAEAIANEIARLCKDPRYANMTMGVISLLGSLHSKLIEKQLMDSIGPEEIQQRELVCGDAYDFQGDERDIIFLSLVSANTDGSRIGTLTKASDERRFNVAASRAKQQMWLFHSATLSDLSPKCVRYKLLDYFQNPHVQQTEIGGINILELRKLSRDADRSINTAPPPFDSWFELDVFFRIHDRGYRVIPQFEIAGRRIDLVVEGVRGRLAVECDGDFWHGPDRYEADMSRQMDLERCGFRFWRLRESLFRLNPDESLNSLWELLASLEISPGGLANTTRPNSTTSTIVNRMAQAVDTTKDGQDDPSDLEIDAVEGDATGGSLATALDATSERMADRIRNMSSQELGAALTEIVRSEGPMPCHRAYRLFARQFELSRVGKHIRSSLNKAVHAAVRAGALLQEDELGSPGQIDRIIRTPEMARLVLRPRGDRTFEEIPLNELAIAMDAETTGDVSGQEKIEMFKAVLARYGLERLTGGAQKRLELAWEIFRNRKAS